MSGTRGAARPRFSECFRFPLATRQARRDLVSGGLWLLATVPGWIVNLGHRLDVIHRLASGAPEPFAGFRPLRATFVRGLTALCAISIYLAPAGGLGLAAWLAGAHVGLFVAAGALFIAAIYVLPGGMTYNAAYGSIHYLYRPDLAARRALEGGRAYLKAWVIAGCAIALSLLGLLALGVGFLFTSVWAWQVVGYAFSLALIPNLGGDAED